jgi:hypothetical protein
MVTEEKYKYMVTEEKCWIFYNAHRDHPNRAYEFLISIKIIASTNHMSLNMMTSSIQQGKSFRGSSLD